MNDAQQRKRDWIHGLLKGIVYNTIDNSLRVISYSIDEKWYQTPNEVNSPLLRKLWNIYLIGWQEIQKQEKADITKQKMHKLMNKIVQICVTILDSDPAWMSRVRTWVYVYDQRKNDKQLEDKNYVIKEQNR